MKGIVLGLFSLVAIISFGDGTNIISLDENTSLRKLTLSEYEKLTPEEKAARKATAMERRYRRTGGTLERPGEKIGEIVYVNCQSRASDGVIAASMDYFKDLTKFNIAIKKGEFELSSPKVVGNASLFIVDDAKLPPLLYAPDSRWAMVNVAPLQTGRGEKTVFFEARVKKQLSRGFAMLCGATNSQFPNCILGGVASIDALDVFADHQLPIDITSRFVPFMRVLGVSPAQTYTYRQACQQGWAPQPTNDVQKVIWDEVHELPKKPLKLEK